MGGGEERMGLPISEQWGNGIADTHNTCQETHTRERTKEHTGNAWPIGKGGFYRENMREENSIIYSGTSEEGIYQVERNHEGFHV